MKKQIIITLLSCALASSAFAQNNATDRMLNRYLSYVSIESQSQYPMPEDGPDAFPIQEGQKQELVELTGFCKTIVDELAN